MQVVFRPARREDLAAIVALLAEDVMGARRETGDVKRHARSMTRPGSTSSVLMSNSMISERGLCRVGSIIITAAATASARSREAVSGSMAPRALSASTGATAAMRASSCRS